MKSIFLETFGESPILRVFDFLILNEEFDYSMIDIAKNSKIGYSTLKLFWKKLEKEKIVIMTRKIGKARMFKLNNENEIVKKIKEIYWIITKNKVRSNLIYN
ncbi:MAG: hypothetical protein QXM96_00635 [Candidatus Woesearchaeota archaeon]